MDGWAMNQIIMFPENPKGIGPFYSNELDTRFNAWLAAKYGDDTKLKQSWSGLNGNTSPELIKNGSFEQNFTDWSTSINTPYVQGTITIDATEAEKREQIGQNSGYTNRGAGLVLAIETQHFPC